MNGKTRTIAAVCGVLMATAAWAEAKSPADLPVSAITNVAYLTDMDGRLWWNAAWKKRAAILVSNRTKVRASKATVDFVFDPGEPIDPKSVRVVTPWEVEVPCVCSRPALGSDNRGEGAPATSDTAVRLLFQTDLREMENRPFFVYWDNPDAQPVKVRSAFSLDVADDEVYVNNGSVEVVFDNFHRTPGLIRKLKVNASPTPDTLLWRTSGYAWEGFSFETEKPKPPALDPEKVRPGNALDAQIHRPDSVDGWSKAIVTEDNALKKTVTFTNAYAAVDFTFYAGESRVNYAYRLAPGLRTATIGVAWACGGGIGHDDFYYPGLTGNVLTRRAALDWVTDCEAPPMEYWRYPWFGAGWYAIADRRTRDVVGMVFDRDSFVGPTYLAGANHCGETARMYFRHKAGKTDCATGSGALVATVGDRKAVADAHELLKTPPCVFVGAVQPYREITVKPRDLAHDFCVNYNVGGWKSAKPLPGDEWAANLMTHLRERGANTILLGQLTDYGWTDLPVSKELYDRICAFQLKKNPKWKAPEWNEKNFNSAKLKQVIAAAHAKGMAVTHWHGPLPGLALYGDVFDPEVQALNREMQVLFSLVGTDSAFNACAGGEGTPLPRDVQKKFGHSYWKWDDPTPYFEARHTLDDYARKFYEYTHRVNPKACVMLFNSDNGELNREMCMPYAVGTVDTLFCEFCAGDGDFPKIKHVAKRLRSFFDNEEGRTIHAHYYSMKLNYAERISQNEQPFICGINGFSNEAMTYENTEPENSQFQADFYRLAEHTRLGEKAAKMAPVRHLAVLRDVDCFAEDIRQKRYRMWSWGYEASRHDLCVNAFGFIPSLSYDIVMNAFFTADALKRYKAVYVPDDDVFSEKLAKELLAYVRDGGAAILEGRTGEKVNVEELKGLEDGKVKEIGKGKVVWTKKALSDLRSKGDRGAGEEIRAMVAKMAGEEPFAISNPSLDGVLQSSAEGLFLGVYNLGAKEERGAVTLNRREGAPATGTFVLDVKTGIRVPFTNGYEITVGPKQCGFYLIGDDAFTAVPKVTEAVWTGATMASTLPDGDRQQVKVDPDFKPLQCTEFVTPAPRNYAGLPAEIDRSAQAMLVRHRFCADEGTMTKKAKTDDFEGWMATNADGARCYTPAAFKRALGASSYLHLQCAGEDCDAIFVDCKEELKDLLKRGGGILFSRTKPGPNAARFLAEVGVFDPWPSSKGGFQEPAMWNPNVSTNHPFCKAKGDWFNANVGCSNKFTKWDAEKQYAPYVDKVRPEGAVMVVQEKVLGAGKVIFTQNRYCFTAWYENRDHGDAVLSFLLGMPVKEHAEKVTRQNGGPGQIVK